MDTDKDVEFSMQMAIYVTVSRAPWDGGQEDRSISAR